MLRSHYRILLTLLKILQSCFGLLSSFVRFLFLSYFKYVLVFLTKGDISKECVMLLPDVSRFFFNLVIDFR